MSLEPQNVTVVLWIVQALVAILFGFAGGAPLVRSLPRAVGRGGPLPGFRPVAASRPLAQC